jgi:hypothetical protein
VHFPGWEMHPFFCPEKGFCWFWKIKTLQNHNRDLGLRDEIPFGKGWDNYDLKPKTRIGISHI